MLYLKGAIIQKDEGNYTAMIKVFDAIENKQLDYNWLITDCVCYPSDNRIDRLLSQKHAWLTGEELTKIVKEEGFQWIWAVLSGFEKNIELDEVLRYDIPYSDENKGFWQLPLSIQHPLAQVEIVPWDGYKVLIISKDHSIINNFMENIPESEDLVEVNKSNI